MIDIETTKNNNYVLDQLNSIEELEKKMDQLSMKIHFLEELFSLF